MKNSHSPCCGRLQWPLVCLLLGVFSGLAQAETAVPASLNAMAETQEIAVQTAPFMTLQPLQPMAWLDANQQVFEIGGWMYYATESATEDSVEGTMDHSKHGHHQMQGQMHQPKAGQQP